MSDQDDEQKKPAPDASEEGGADSTAVKDESEAPEAKAASEVEDPSEDQVEEDDEAEEDEEDVPPRAQAKVRQASERRPGAKAQSGSSPAGTQLALAAVLALLAGGAAGWFGQVEYAKQELKKAAGGGDMCEGWKDEVCKKQGDESAACGQAKAAASLLSTASCKVAMQTIPETLKKLEAAQAACKKMADKVCAELPKGSKACELLRKEAPNFPADKCDDKSYDEILTTAKMIDQRFQGAGPGMPGMRGMPGSGPRGPGGPGGPGAPGVSPVGPVPVSPGAPPSQP